MAGGIRRGILHLVIVIQYIGLWWLENNHISNVIVDYMTIDTEGSEVSIIQDFPWNDFDVRVVQIEQLNELEYPAQVGKKDKIIQHMTSFNYTLLSVFVVAERDTDDLIFVRNLDEVLNMATDPRDAKGTNAKTGLRKNSSP